MLFAFAISMYHLHDLLIRFGMRTLYAAIKAKRTEKKQFFTMMMRDEAYNRLMLTLEASYADVRNVSLDSSVNFGGGLLATQAPAALEEAGSTELPVVSEEETRKAESSHPKFPALKRVLHEHFQAAHQSDDTRVMIFSTFRNSVSEIVDYLKRFRPLIRPVEFKGQSGGGVTRRRSSVGTPGASSRKKTPKAGKEAKKAETEAMAETTPGSNTAPMPKPKRTTQRVQLATVQQFKDGVHNVLVSTSVGEEGLDIGEVDLIVCFDAPKSSTRLVQRCGRTGRKREGKIIVLLTEGKEERNYNQAQHTKKRMNWAMGVPAAKTSLPFRPSRRLVPDPTTRSRCVLVSAPSGRPEFDPALYRPKRRSSAKATKDTDPTNPHPPAKKEPKKRSKAQKGGGKSESPMAEDKAEGDVEEKVGPLVGVEDEYIFISLLPNTADQHLSEPLRLKMEKLMVELTQSLADSSLARTQLEQFHRRRPKGTPAPGKAGQKGSDPNPSRATVPETDKSRNVEMKKRSEVCQKEEVTELAEECGEVDSFGLGFDFGMASPPPRLARSPSLNFDTGVSPPPSTPNPPSLPPPALSLQFSFHDSPSPHKVDAPNGVNGVGVGALDLGLDLAACSSPEADGGRVERRAEKDPEIGMDLDFNFFGDEENAEDDEDFMPKTPTPKKRSVGKLRSQNSLLSSDADMDSLPDSPVL